MISLYTDACHHHSHPRACTSGEVMSWDSPMSFSLITAHSAPARSGGLCFLQPFSSPDVCAVRVMECANLCCTTGLPRALPCSGPGEPGGHEEGQETPEKRTVCEGHPFSGEGGLRLGASRGEAGVSKTGDQTHGSAAAPKLNVFSALGRVFRPAGLLPGPWTQQAEAFPWDICLRACPLAHGGGAAKRAKNPCSQGCCLEPGREILERSD